MNQQKPPHKKNIFSQMEEEIIDFWEHNRCFEQSVENRPKEKGYVFYDGPPFATGLPHYGHILSSTIKDVVPRYWTMKGYRVERRWGWDCHGLPIENIAEKELQISGKKDIEEIGVQKFNEFCRSKVLDFAGEWGSLVRRIGRWTEFENSYKTLDNTYIESVWWAVKQVHEKGFLYEGRKVLLYCPRCETPISNFEVAMDNSYKDVTDTALYVKFKAKNEENVFFLAWTTTPWTLPSNIALAVGADIDYVQIRQNNEEYILAEARLDAVQGEYELIKKMKGNELVNMEYEPLYEVKGLKELGKKSHYVAAADFVTTDDGTGIVHTAVVYGEDDYQLGLKLDLPLIPALDETGTFTDVLPQFAGMYFKKANAAVIEDLQSRQLLYKQEAYTHSYPHCYRCETPLYYNAIPAWFINVQKIKQRLIENNEQINWVPEYFKHGRFLQGLETAPDWNISRNRYWASPLPIWKCRDCGTVEVIGSTAELKEKAVDPSQVIEGMDLHKHSVDPIQIRCSQCEKPAERIPEVIDCWVESASMPFAAQHYPFENREWFEQNFPAQFVAEYVGQTRAWFYVMLVLSTILFDKEPFENVVVTGNILAEDGAKMSKSKKNFPDPWEIFEKYGVDALRYYLMSTPVMNSENVNFSDREVDEIYKKLISTLWNVYTFYNMFQPKKDDAYTPQYTHVLDRWILTKAFELQTTVTKHMDAYEVVPASRPLLEFVQELSTWYVRRIRSRVKGDNEQDKQEALYTLHLVLTTFVKVAAPIIPFITEKVYQGLRAESDPVSVHLCDWPEIDNARNWPEVLKEMDGVREYIEKSLALRAEAGIKVRQPLPSITIPGQPLAEEYQNIFKEELNVKEVQFGGNELQLDTTITEELRAEGMLRELIRQTNSLRKKKRLTINDRVDISVHTKSTVLRSLLESQQQNYLKSVLGTNLVFADEPQEHPLNIDGEPLTISL